MPTMIGMNLRFREFSMHRTARVVLIGFSVFSSEYSGAMLVFEHAFSFTRFFSFTDAPRPRLPQKDMSRNFSMHLKKDSWRTSECCGSRLPRVDGLLDRQPGRFWMLRNLPVASSPSLFNNHCGGRTTTRPSSVWHDPAGSPTLRGSFTVGHEGERRTWMGRWVSST